MEDFVNESHGIDLPGSDRLLREIDQIPFFIYFLGEDPDCMEAWEDDISAEGKKSVVKLIEVPRLPGDMKLHHDCILGGGSAHAFHR